MPTPGRLLECIRRAWDGLVQLWPVSRLSNDPLLSGFYHIRNKQSGAFAALPDANEYSDMIALIPHMGLTRGQVVGSAPTIRCKEFGTDGVLLYQWEVVNVAQSRFTIRNVHYRSFSGHGGGHPSNEDSLVGKKSPTQWRIQGVSTRKRRYYL